MSRCLCPTAGSLPCACCMSGEGEALAPGAGLGAQEASPSPPLDTAGGAAPGGVSPARSDRSGGWLPLPQGQAQSTLATRGSLEDTSRGRRSTSPGEEARSVQLSKTTR